jgi:hypothetical protein
MNRFLIEPHGDHQAGKSRLKSPHWKTLHTFSCLLFFLLLPLSGCRFRRAVSAIPSHVSPKEVNVYQAWLQDFHAQQKSPQKMNYVETETWPYQTGCDKTLLKQGVSPENLQSLRDLGDARYLIPPFNIGVARTFDSFATTINGRSLNEPFFRHIFSRVAFSPNGRQAFFHAEYVRGPGMGQGGWGEDILATDDGHTWHFQTVGCPTIID